MGFNVRNSDSFTFTKFAKRLQIAHVAEFKAPTQNSDRPAKVMLFLK
jgi:hypothetical protein